MDTVHRLDRKTGTEVAVYESTVEEQYSPYIRPQAYGNKTDVRWTTLTNGEIGLAAFGHPEMNVSVRYMNTENLDRALFDYQIHDNDGVTLNVGHTITGVAGKPIQSLMENRTLPDKSFEFVIGFKLLTGESSLMELSQRNLPYAFASSRTLGNQTINLDTETNELNASATVRNLSDTKRTIDEDNECNSSRYLAESASI